MEEIIEIEKRELEKVRLEMAREICREVMVELVTMVEAVSVTEKVMEQVQSM